MKNIYNFIYEKLRLGKDTVPGKEKDPYDSSTWDVGDILAGTVGYSMVLPRFYKIIKRTAKSFTVQRMESKIVSGHRNGQWEEVADEKAPLKGVPTNARIRKSGSVVVNDCYVHLWNGEPLHGDDMD